jgi:predicted flap endonuclease-1-like 5' DNA nuclease
MRQATRLVRDSAGRYKLKVSLSGGRYQLSLDDRAVNVLVDQLGASVRDTVPEPYVPFFIAMGDAWFPRQRDTDAIVRALPPEGTLSREERSVLSSYLTDSWIAERRENQVLEVLGNSPIADEVDPGSLRVRELPSVPDSLESNPEEPQTAKVPDGDDGSANHGRRRTTESSAVGSDGAMTATETLEELQRIPGIGPHRAKSLIDAGVESLASVAATRPTDLTVADGISEGIAIVAIEGAREVLGQRTPASERLALQTGVPEQVFSAALSSLAGSGIPASEALPSLRALFGPTVADIEGVSGQQAYFLWEAGYQTPYDVGEASLEELTEVYQIGSVTAPEIKESADEMVGEADE